MPPRLRLGSQLLVLLQLEQERCLLAGAQLSTRERGVEDVLALVGRGQDPNLDLLEVELERSPQARVPVEHDSLGSHLQRHLDAALADVGAEGQVGVFA